MSCMRSSALTRPE